MNLIESGLKSNEVNKRKEIPPPLANETPSKNDYLNRLFDEVEREIPFDHLGSTENTIVGGGGPDNTHLRLVDHDTTPNYEKTIIEPLLQTDHVEALAQKKETETPTAERGRLDKARRALLPEMATLRAAAGEKGSASPEGTKYLELYQQYQAMTKRIDEINQNSKQQIAA